MGPVICSDLPAFHAVTGCDFNLSFHRKGKKDHGIILCKWKIPKSIHSITRPYSNDYKDAFATLEEFVCKLYATARNGLKCAAM